MKLASFRTNVGRRAFALLFILASLSVVGCRRVTKEDVIGHWEVKYKESTLELILKEDGTFEQIFRKNGNSTSVRRSGRWEIKEFDKLDGQELLLHNPLIIDEQTGMIDPELSSSKDDGVWILHVWKGFGTARMPVNEDLDLYFDRQKPGKK